MGKRSSKAEESTTNAVQLPATQCGAWAFILGAALSAFCGREQGHEGNHQTEITVYAEPRSHFTIIWALEDKAANPASP